MNTLTYVISSNTLDAGTNGIDIFESGATNLTLSMSGITSTVGTYQYLKFLIEYSDLDEIYTLQNTTDLLSGAHLNISRVFYPGDTFHTTYTIDVSGLKTDLTVDLYRVNFTLSKPPLNFYKDHKLVNSYLHTNQHSINSLLVTIEAEHPNYTGNFYIPYNKDVNVYLPDIPPPYVAGDDTILRTETQTFGGGMVPLVTEVYSRGDQGNDFIIKEHQYKIFAIGANEKWQDPIGYKSALLVGVSGNQVTVPDINGVEQTEVAFVIVPEDGIDYSEHWTQGNTFRSETENNAPNAQITLIFHNSDIQHPESTRFKHLI